MSDSPGRPDGAIRPDPDPTAATTAALHRDLAALRDLFDARLTGLSADVHRVHEDVEKIPHLVDEKVDRVLRLHEEKFQSIQVQFTERDTRTEQTSRDTKTAVDAALQAAKEAVGEQNKSSALAIAKSETATMKAIDQIVTLVQTSVGGLNDKIDDLKDRLTTIEGRGSGYAASWVVALGALGAIATIVSIAAAIFAFTR